MICLKIMEFLAYIFVIPLSMPYLALTGGLFYLVRWHLRQPGEAARFRLHTLIAAVIACYAFLAWGVYEIFSSTSSTAAIGLIFLPFYSIAVAAAAFAVAWAGFTGIALVGSVRSHLGWPVPRWPHLALAAAILAVAMAGGSWGTSRQLLLQEADSEATSEERLGEIARQAMAANNVDLLANVVRNSTSSAELLGLIFDHCLALGPIDGQARCYQVFVNIAGHRKASPAMLARLGDARDPALLTMVGTNRNTPVPVLEQLAHNPSSLVRTWVAGNPHLPLEALTPLADDPNPTTRNHARTALKRRGGKVSSP